MSIKCLSIRRRRQLYCFSIVCSIRPRNLSHFRINYSFGRIDIYGAIGSLNGMESCLLSQRSSLVPLVVCFDAVLHCLIHSQPFIFLDVDGKVLCVVLGEIRLRPPSRAANNTLMVSLLHRFQICSGAQSSSEPPIIKTISGETSKAPSSYRQIITSVQYSQFVTGQPSQESCQTRLSHSCRVSNFDQRFTTLTLSLLFKAFTTRRELYQHYGTE